MGISFNGSAVIGAAQTPLHRYFPLLGRAGLDSLQPEVSYALGSPKSLHSWQLGCLFGRDAEILFHLFQKVQLLAILD